MTTSHYLSVHRNKLFIAEGNGLLVVRKDWELTPHALLEQAAQSSRSSQCIDVVLVLWQYFAQELGLDILAQGSHRSKRDAPYCDNVLFSLPTIIKHGKWRIVPLFLPYSNHLPQPTF